MINFLTQQIFPNLYTYFYANKKVSKIYDQISIYEVKDIEENKIDLSLKIIEQELENQLTRKKAIEEKVKAILFIITISITAITFSLNHEKWHFDSTYESISLITLCISIIYFIFAAISCIQTLNLRPFNVISKKILIDQNLIEMESEKTNSEKLKEYIKYKALNENIITQLSNFAYSSFTSIRNGIILFCLYFIFALFQNFINYSEKNKNIFNISNEIEVKISDSSSVQIPFNLKFELISKEFNSEKIKYIQTKPSKQITDSLKK